MIKTIAFDLGGVYFTHGARIALKKLYTMLDIPKNELDEKLKNVNDTAGNEYRRGKLTRDEYWIIVQKALGVDAATAKKMEINWHSSYTPNTGMPELVAALRKKHRVVAFTGSIKERADYLDKKYNLLKTFDEIVFTFNVGFTKKEKEFYPFFLDVIKCRPEECVAVDDKQHVLDKLKALGAKTVLFKDANQVAEDLKKFGVKI